MTDHWWRTGPGIAAVAFPLLVCAFTLGQYFGGSRVDACEVKCERQLNGKEGELRECTKTNASLQAVLQLSDKDRFRLLEAAAVEPPARIAFQGQPLAGRVELNASGNCAEEMNIWFENTGMRDIVAAGAELLLPPRFSNGSEVQPVFENGTKTSRHWVPIGETLPPGARRYAAVEFCATSSLRDGEEMPAKLRFFSSGFLPLTRDFTIVLRVPK